MSDEEVEGEEEEIALVGGDDEEEEESEEKDEGTEPAAASPGADPEEEDGKDDEKEKEKESEPTVAAKKKKLTPKAVPALPKGSVLVYYNRQYWIVDLANVKRKYDRPFFASTCEQLGLMIAGDKKAWPDVHSGKGKPPPCMLSPAQIVVLEGKLKEDDTDDMNVWYVLVDVENGPESNDDQVLRHVPKEIYKKCIAAWSLTEEMRNSSLLKTWKGSGDNERAFNPQVNGWIKYTHLPAPVTAAVQPPKEKKDKAVSKAKTAVAAKKDKEEDKEKKEEKKEEKKKEEKVEKKKEEKEEKEDDKEDEKKKDEKEDKEDKKKPDEPEVVKKAAPITAPKATASVMSSFKAAKDDKKKEVPKNESSTPGLKRKRQHCVETIEYDLCSVSDVTFPSFKVPDGATGASVKIEWEF